MVSAPSSSTPTIQPSAQKAWNSKNVRSNTSSTECLNKPATALHSIAAKIEEENPKGDGRGAIFRAREARA